MITGCFVHFVNPRGEKLLVYLSAMPAIEIISTVYKRSNGFTSLDPAGTMLLSLLTNFLRNRTVWRSAQESGMEHSFLRTTH